ncbi:MAG: Secretion system C-terminal sorting domain [Bacteroidota bacterium]|jgi:hypothetical protein
MQAYTYHLAKGIVPSDLIENNQVHTNIVYSTTMASGTHEITTEQAYSNSEIAHQCPLSGGKSVYLARTLYYKLHPGELYDDEAICLQEDIIFRKANPFTRFNNKLTVFPNPTTGIITVTASNAVIEGSVIVYDIAGKAIFKQKELKEINSFNIDLSSLHNAIYILKVFDGQTELTTEKITIIK